MKKKNYFKILIIVFFILNISFFLHQFLQKKSSYKIATIAFYNVENLFDTIQSIDYINGFLSPDNPSFHISIPLDSNLAKQTPIYKGLYSDYIFFKKKIKVLRPLAFSNDFTPNGIKKWTLKRYKIKLKHISKVISEIKPVILGLAEVENKKVLLDLVNQPVLKKYNYEIIHYNSYDTRGIDCGIIYQKKRFFPTKTKHYVIYGLYTRDILLVEGKLDGEYIYVIVNHWPSKIGKNSDYKRYKASKVLGSILKEIQNKNAKIIIMGDFNDNPNTSSIKLISNKKYKIFNTMNNICTKTKGTYMYKNKWNCLDQIMLSYNLINNLNNYHMYKIEIFKKRYLIKSGSKQPFRTFKGNKYLGGYSDHLPVYIILIKKLN
ncbi:MAG: endonuclease [Candidatus Bostrichicola ureolyticus]|nr:MAG: endonuclease [Candidatus Bostrichicola ureolyticus]